MLIIDMLTPAPHHKMVAEATGGFLHPGGRDLTRAALDAAGLPAGALILDAGCGFGTASVLMREMGFRPLGADLSPANLEQSREHLDTPRLMRASIEALPLSGGCLDGVLCECVLSLTARPDSALSEFHRTLKPGGVLLLNDLYDRSRVPSPGHAGSGKPSTCCLEGVRTASDLAALLREAGFETESMEDRSRALAQLAGQMLFNGHSLSDFRNAALPQARVNRSRTSEVCSLSGHGKPGYLTIRARKPLTEARPHI